MPRQTNRLTAKKVAGLKEPGYHADGGGLYLRIRDGGGRSWVTIKRVGNSRVERAIAPGETSLAEAREIARKPVNTTTTQAPTFGDWADEYVATHRDTWKNEKHAAQWETTLKVHAKPLRGMRVDRIETDDILAVLNPIWRKTHETATRLRGRIEKILDAARAADHIPAPYENPARWKGHLEFFLPRGGKFAKGGHHTAVPWAEAPAFWAALLARQESTSAMALRFTILCATRTGETIGARWREIDLEGKRWTIPKDRMKMDEEHIVPLSDAALDVLRVMGAPGMAPNDYVFPGPRRGKPLSNMAMLVLLQRQMEVAATVHGFRSTFRDWAGEATNYPRDVVEMALAHAVGSKVEAAYRRGRAVEKRRPLMQEWADYLGGFAGALGDREAA